MQPATVAARGTGSMSDTLWDDVLARVEGKVNRHSFATWFRPTTYLSLDGSTLRIGVPNAQFREWLSKNYLGVLQEALAEAGHPSLRVAFEEIAEEAVPVAAAAPAERDSSPLNPKYTFDTFVVGSSNQLAHAAAWRSPTTPPRPTTRSSSTAAWASARRTSCTRSATTSWPARPEARERALHLDRTFINELINSIRYERMPSFRSKYRDDGPAAHRRHPVHRRQGADPGGVLPHLQRAPRVAQADRADLGQVPRDRSPTSRSACARASSGA